MADDGRGLSRRTDLDLKGRVTAAVRRCGGPNTGVRVRLYAYCICRYEYGRCAGPRWPRPGGISEVSSAVLVHGGILLGGQS